MLNWISLPMSSCVLNFLSVTSFFPSPVKSQRTRDLTLSPVTWREQAVNHDGADCCLMTGSHTGCFSEGTRL